MSSLIQVCEYATLRCNIKPGTGNINVTTCNDLSCAEVSEPTFRWLLKLRKQRVANADFNISANNTENSAPLDEELVLTDPHELKIGSYVGYLQSPTGEGIEILPKTAISTQNLNVDVLRELLCEMVLCAMNLTPKKADVASLKKSRMPLHEWIIHQFLSELQTLIQKGLRHNYTTIENECHFIRGRLNVTKQMRQPPGRAHLFHLRYHIFSMQTLENKLIKTALDLVLKITKSNDNWRVASHLSHQLAEVQSFHQINDALSQMPKWRNDKLMRHYQKIQSWTQLILERLNPHFQFGYHQGIAMLFPMEKLFERYVEHHLRVALQSKTHKKWHLEAQSNKKYFLRHCFKNSTSEQTLFQLIPDFLISQLEGNHKKIKYVLDTKWKLIDETAARDKKYGISQTDLYQMYAYSHAYLEDEKSSVVLIYPFHPKFQIPLPAFKYIKNLYLWCIPFDLKAKKLIMSPDSSSYFIDLFDYE